MNVTRRQALLAGLGIVAGVRGGVTAAVGEHVEVGYWTPGRPSFSSASLLTIRTETSAWAGPEPPSVGSLYSIVFVDGDGEKQPLRTAVRCVATGPTWCLWEQLQPTVRADGAQSLEWRADREPASGVFTRIRRGTEVIPVPIADAERLCGELNRAAAQGRAKCTACLSNLLGRNSKQV